MKKNINKIASNSLARSLFLTLVLAVLSCLGFGFAFGYGGGFIGGGGGTSLPAVVTAVNVPLSVSAAQEGKITKSLENSTIEVSVPKGAVAGKTTFDVNSSYFNNDNRPSGGASLIGNRIIRITAEDIEGDEVSSFLQDLSITFKVAGLPSDTANLGLYYFNETKKVWTLIPGAQFNPAAGSVSFHINHLTDFAVFEVASKPAEISVSGAAATNETGSTAAVASKKINITNANLLKQVSGKIILKVEQNGEAYYINPAAKVGSYLGRPADAFGIMRSEGIGITNANLEKIAIGYVTLTGQDADGDGLSDIFEDAIGTDKTKADTDGDGYSDKTEVESGYNPSGENGALKVNNSFASAQAGKIFLQVEGAGEAWYINPANNKRYYLGRPGDAFNVMRFLGLGISNANFDNLTK